MYNFNIKFSYPWLLLLLIPAFAFTLFSYFRLSKKYRRTRNRIISIVLHIIIMALSILTLSGTAFAYEVYNPENELILLVDVSESQEQAQKSRDEFVKTILDIGQYDNFKIGIVTFGFDSVYAVPLTYNIKSIYDDYLDASLPDTSATDIAAALIYTKTLFTHPETSKIVLITDGKETDEEALTVIRTVAVQGIQVDVAYIPSEYEGSDVQLSGVELPDYHVNVGEECTINVIVQSKSSVLATIEMYDNDSIEPVDIQLVALAAGMRTVSFKHTFATDGFHQIAFNIVTQDDLIEQNNRYYSYIFLEHFNKILILERKDGESAMLSALLTAEDVYDVEVMNVYTSRDIPSALDGLRAYDQIILNNISNADLSKNDNMPAEFDAILEAYVNEYGGGLFTVGGNNDFGEANAYNRADMYNTLYQKMLPVQAIDYTPPLGVIVIVDRSGSMGSTDNSGITYLEWAKAGAATCLDALTERDYFGLMTLDSDYSTILPLTQRTKESEIRAAIERGIGDATGGTVFPGAIERAGQALRALKSVDRRHIIIVSDGGVPEDQRLQYENLVKGYYDSDGITLSVVGIGITKDSPFDETTPIEQLDKENLTVYERMLRAVVLGHGRIYPIQGSEIRTLPPKMREDLKAPDIKEVNHKEFNPTVNNVLSPLLKGVERTTTAESWNKLTVELYGFYGVKIRPGADLILHGEFEVPIYAQWKYGKGMVGSFMCDLNGSWSSKFLGDSNGQRFINNVIANLMPIENIRPNQISVVMKEYNYINNLSIYTNLEANQYIQGQIIEIAPDGEETSISLNSVTEAQDSCFVTLALSSFNNYSRANFVIKNSGTYKIVLTKYGKDGTVLSVFETYKTFSYSKEYNTFLDESEKDIESKLQALVIRGNGKMIEDLEEPSEIFKGFNTHISKTFDPRFLFILLAGILFLLDIVVRKFRFKWPHELYREYKEKKLSQK